MSEKDEKNNENDGSLSVRCRNKYMKFKLHTYGARSKRNSTNWRNRNRPSDNNLVVLYMYMYILRPRYLCFHRMKTVGDNFRNQTTQAKRNKCEPSVLSPCCACILPTGEFPFAFDS